MKVVPQFSYLASCIFICLGFYKLFCYKSIDEAIVQSQTVNAVVGGDAYNYIINTQTATAYFVLALIFTIIGSTFLIIDKLNGNKKEAV